MGRYGREGGLTVSEKKGQAKKVTPPLKAEGHPHVFIASEVRNVVTGVGYRVCRWCGQMKGDG